MEIFAVKSFYSSVEREVRYSEEKRAYTQVQAAVGESTLSQYAITLKKCDEL
jgi:hypothetical protein